MEIGINERTSLKSGGTVGDEKSPPTPPVVKPELLGSTPFRDQIVIFNGLTLRFFVVEQRFW
ncbi:hypothetical protein, partial [Thalassospira lucentensis]|uniref:hypothetical protein n=1 Tax=Thalassospira lucentensis TaxID=168935 RepID=UPI0023F936EC